MKLNLHNLLRAGGKVKHYTIYMIKFTEEEKRYKGRGSKRGRDGCREKRNKVLRK